MRFVFETYGDRVTLSMMSQYTPPASCPGHPESERRPSAEEYEELLDFADSIGCDEYFWQDGDAAEESFIPDFDSLEGVVGEGFLRVRPLLLTYIQLVRCRFRRGSMRNAPERRRG